MNNLSDIWGDLMLVLLVEGLLGVAELELLPVGSRLTARYVLIGGNIGVLISRVIPRRIYLKQILCSGRTDISSWTACIRHLSTVPGALGTVGV